MPKKLPFHSIGTVNAKKKNYISTIPGNDRISVFFQRQRKPRENNYQYEENIRSIARISRIAEDEDLTHGPNLNGYIFKNSYRYTLDW